MPKQKRNTSRITIITLFLLISLFLGGCGFGDPAPGDPNDPKIGLVTGEGGIEDPYYQKAWEGLLKLQQDGKAQVGYVKAKNVKDYASKLNQLKNEKYEIIITIGQNPVPAVIEAASQNPKLKYICLDSIPEGKIPANVLGVTYKTEEAAFLAGYLAGKVTQSNVAGFISENNKAAAMRYYYGFKAGLRLASPYCELMKGISGNYSDQARLKEMAQRMVQARADIIFHVTGSAGKGMIKVMAENNKYAIGSYVDQNKVAPENVLSSVVINHDRIISELIDKYQNRSLLLGKNEVYGLKEGAVGLAETTKDMVSESLYEQILKYQDKITSGELVIPATEEEYLNF